MQKLTWTEINKSKSSIFKALKEGYTHILWVDGLTNSYLYVLHEDAFDKYVNEIASENGRQYSDSSQYFFGCPLSEFRDHIHFLLNE